MVRRVVWVLWGLPLIAAMVGVLRRAESGPTVRMSIPQEGEAGEKVRFGDAHLRGKFALGDARVDGERTVVAIDGEEAELTIDPAIQRRAEEVLREADAAIAGIVVMHVDGRILALAARAEDGTDDLEVLTRPWAPAASIFKLVTAAALLDRGVESDERVCFHGGVRSVEESNLEDDAARDQSCGDLAFGVAHSQNAIIAKLAHKHLDVEALRESAAQLGFGWSPDFALPVTAAPAHDLPSRGLELARAAAGFHHSDLSPLGGAVLAATLASGGLRVTPRVVARVGERAVIPVAPQRVMDPDTAEFVGEMMVGTVATGTAWRGFHDKKGQPHLGETRVAGKTGSLSGKRGKTLLNYSWFVGFAPADAPQVVVSVVLGNGPSWRLKAHTAARLVLEAALSE